MSNKNEKFIIVLSVFLIFLSGLNTIVNYELLSTMKGEEGIKNLFSNNNVKLKDISENYLGNLNSDIVVLIFSDFECPYCGASEGTHKGLIDGFKAQDPTWEAAIPKLRELAKDNKIKLVFKQYPLDFHQYAQKSAEASLCASEQGKFWEYHDVLFENQNALSTAKLSEYAESLGLNVLRFDECLDSGIMREKVSADINEGNSLGVRGTPAFVINGQLLSGAQSFSAINQVINAMRG